MKEIKFVSHLSRNIYLYFGSYLAVSFISNFHTSILHFLLGLTAFFIGYAPVYFVNDFVDRQEDAKHGKSNLFSYINNSRMYWTIAILTMLVGVSLSYFINPSAVLLLLIMFLCNIFYSIEPFRVRNRLLFNVLLIFILYAIKFYYVALLLHIPMTSIPLSLVVMSGSTAALSVTFYKRHIKRHRVSEYICAFLFVASWLITIVFYHQLFFLLFPLIFPIFYFHLKYKTQPIPIGRYQSFYFLYTIIVWFVQSHGTL